MKRALYFTALLCVFGTLLCLSRRYAMPKNEAQSASSAPDDDWTSRFANDDFFSSQSPADNLLRDALVFVVLGGVCFLVGRRIR